MERELSINQEVRTAEPFENFAKSNAMSGQWDDDGIWRGQIQIYGEIKWRWFQFIQKAPPEMNITILGPYVKFRPPYPPGETKCPPKNRPW